MTSQESQPAYHEQSFEWLARTSGEAETTLKSDENLTKLPNDINHQIEAIKKAKRDSLDIMVAYNIGSLATLSNAGIVIGNVLGPASMLLNGINIGVGAVEAAALVMRGRQKHSLLTVHITGDYSIQCLYAQRESAIAQKGQVIAFVNPPSTKGKAGPIVYDEGALEDIIHVLSQTTVDAAIMPLDPTNETTEAIDIKQLMGDIKGYNCSVPYPEGTKATCVTKEQLNKLAAGDIHRKILQRVAANYPLFADHLQTPAAQRVIEDLLKQELIVDSRIRVGGFNEDGEFDIVTINRAPQVVGPMISMESDRTELNQVRPIASVAPLSPGLEKEISQRLDSGSYDNLSVLALAWQSVGKQQVPPDQSMQRRDYLKSPGLGPSRRENMRLLRRIGVGAIGSLLYMVTSSMIQADSDEILPGLAVRANGNASIEGYYAASAVSDINGDTLEWTDIDDVVYDVPDELMDAPVKNYIEASIIRDVGPEGVVNIPIKEHTRLAALQVTDGDGNVLSYNLLYSAEMLPFIKVDTKGVTRVQITYKLIAAEGSGIAVPQRPITAYGNHQPNEDRTLRFDISAEQLAGQFRKDITYNTGEPLDRMLKGANAANLARKVYQRGIANCDVSAKIVALNNSVAHDDKMAYVEGFLVQDTEIPKEEYVLVSHAWVATEYEPHIDATPPLPPGATPADVGLPTASQQEASEIFADSADEFEPAKHYPFPWEPLALLGGLAVGGVALNQRQRLALAVARPFDKMRQKVLSEPVSIETLRGLLAYETFATFDIPESANDFPALRQQMTEAAKTMTNASITNEALQRVLNKESLLVKALLNKKERRSARRQAVRILRERKWQALHQRRQKKT